LRNAIRVASSEWRAFQRISSPAELNSVVRFCRSVEMSPLNGLEFRDNEQDKFPHAQSLFHLCTDSSFPGFYVNEEPGAEGLPPGTDQGTALDQTEVLPDSKPSANTSPVTGPTDVAAVSSQGPALVTVTQYHCSKRGSMTMLDVVSPVLLR
jgi:hypothetical protein